VAQFVNALRSWAHLSSTSAPRRAMHEKKAFNCSVGLKRAAAERVAAERAAAELAANVRGLAHQAPTTDLLSTLRAPPRLPWVDF
jgi:hypothetical protein